MGSWAMGRFELIVGEERNGFPVYKQAHSQGMLEKKKVTLLYRYRELNIQLLLLPSGVERSGWLKRRGEILLV